MIQSGRIDIITTIEHNFSRSQPRKIIAVPNIKSVFNMKARAQKRPDRRPFPKGMPSKGNVPVKYTLRAKPRG